ncbi:MAG: class IV adenylate cyclase [Acidobacteriota bacterium]
MSIEIEKKYRLPAGGIQRMQKKLEQIGAEFVRHDTEENIIYGGEPLNATGGVLRVRTTPDRCTLTYKRRLRSDSDAKTQIEHETEVSDRDAIRSIISELGLKPRVIYEKRRSVWRMKKAEVVLDDLPFGEFMEIEGSVTSIRECEMLLDIDDLEVEHATYPQLTAKLGKPEGDAIAARF